MDAPTSEEADPRCDGGDDAQRSPIEGTDGALAVGDGSPPRRPGDGSSVGKLLLALRFRAPRAWTHLGVGGGSPLVLPEKADVKRSLEWRVTRLPQATAATGTPITTDVTAEGAAETAAVVAAYRDRASEQIDLSRVCAELSVKDATSNKRRESMSGAHAHSLAAHTQLAAAVFAVALTVAERWITVARVLTAASPARNSAALIEEKRDGVVLPT
mmetsp:Transcript_21728/g.65933  ORF Transcript_21728/g.65933 Transcript_21728/m.65933 type:complete len:215 (-) Transcript_21728:528-1172(-)|eukprot:scaffold131539_cov33-Tisochrysis_lutea.AAC.5